MRKTKMIMIGTILVLLISIWQNCNKGGRIMSDAIEINAMNLYILSNYEKGRLCTSRLIAIWEKKRLKISIEMMAKIESMKIFL